MQQTCGYASLSHCLDFELLTNGLSFSCLSQPYAKIYVSWMVLTMVMIFNSDGFDHSIIYSDDSHLVQYASSYEQQVCSFQRFAHSFFLLHKEEIQECAVVHSASFHF